MSRFKIKYKSAALLVILLLFLKGLVSAIYYFGTNDFMDINGFRIIGEVKVDYLNIALQIIFIFFTIMSFFKSEHNDFKKVFITILFLIMTVQYAFFFKDQFFTGKVDKSSVSLVNYPKEIDKLIEQEIEFKSNRIKKISVEYSSSKQTDEKGTILFEGIDSSEYDVNVAVFNLKNTVELYNESYMLRIDNNFNLIYKHPMEDFILRKRIPKRWKFETLKKNFDFF